MPSTTHRLVFAQVGGLVAVGMIARLAGALVASRLLRSLLFAVSRSTR